MIPNPLSCEQTKFNQICEELNQLHTPGHERIQWEGSTSSDLHVTTYARPNWLFRFVKRLITLATFRKANECEKTVDFSLRFFQANERHCVGNSSVINKLVSIKFYNDPLRQRLTSFIDAIRHKEVMAPTEEKCKSLLETARQESENVKTQTQQWIEAAKEEKARLLAANRALVEEGKQHKQDLIKCNEQRLQELETSIQKTSLRLTTLTQEFDKKTELEIEKMQQKVQQQIKRAEEEKEHLITANQALAEEGEQHKQDLIKRNEQRLKELEASIQKASERLEALKQDCDSQVNTLIVCKNGEKIRVHMRDLRESIPFFACQAQNTMQGGHTIDEEDKKLYPSLTRVFTWNDYSSQAVSCVIEASRNLKLLERIENPSLLLEMYHLTDYLTHQSLSEACKQRLERIYEGPECLKLLRQEDLDPEDPLTESIYKQVSLNFKEYCQAKQFSQIAAKHLIQILKLDDLNVDNEAMVLEAVYKWHLFGKQKEDLALVLYKDIEGEKLADHIRFEYLDEESRRKACEAGLFNPEKLKAHPMRPCRPLTFQLKTLNPKNAEITWRIPNAKHFIDYEMTEVSPSFSLDGYTWSLEFSERPGGVNRDSSTYPSCKYLKIRGPAYATFGYKIQIGKLILSSREVMNETVKLGTRANGTPVIEKRSYSSDLGKVLIGIYELQEQCNSEVSHLEVKIHLSVHEKSK